MNKRKELPGKNPFHYEDKRIQHFSNLWFLQRKTATVEQKDKIGLAYISKVLGLGEEVARRFAQGDHEAYHAVGLKQSAIPFIDTTEFWKEVSRIFPGTYTDKDIKFLSRNKDVYAVLHFLWQIEVPLAEESPILNSLATNAHAYK